MNFITNFINKILVFEKEPQRIGLSQIKPQSVTSEITEPSIKNKNVKLSDLMRRAG